MNYRDKLIARGWNQIGHGMYANVFEHPNKNYILKMFKNDPCYISFIKQVLKNNNPHLPKSFGFGKIKNTLTYFIKLEKLYPLTKEDWNNKELQFMLHNTFGNINNSYEMDGSTKIDFSGMDIKSVFKNPDKAKLKDALKLIRTAKNITNCDVDLHPGNLMKTKDGVLVITDPLSHSIRDVKLDNNEIEDHIRNEFSYMTNKNISETELAKVILKLIPEFKNDSKFFQQLFFATNKAKNPILIKKFIKENNDIEVIYTMFMHDSLVEKVKDVLSNKPNDYFIKAFQLKFINANAIINIAKFIDFKKLTNEQFNIFVKFFFDNFDRQCAKAFSTIYNQHKQELDNMPENKYFNNLKTLLDKQKF